MHNAISDQDIYFVNIAIIKFLYVTQQLFLAYLALLCQAS